MSEVFRSALRMGSAAILGSIAVATLGSSVAAEVTDLTPATPSNTLGEPSTSELINQINNYGSEGSSNSINQVTNVNQLRDVSPGDWAYEALRNLVETYGCIAGYPDGTYRGNRAMTRYEFAAGLNACLQQIERLIAASTADFVTRDDLVILQRLLGEFEAELATLGTRVDNLEGRVAFLEDHQFSTTTKLNGQVLNYIFVTAGDDVDDNQATFSSRVRLNFDTSFTGKDRLRTRLQAQNIIGPADPNGSNSLAQNLGGNSGNNVTMSKLIYSFPVNDRITGHIGTTGVLNDDIFDAASTNGLAYDALALFPAYNNLIYDNSNSGGAGLGFNLDLDFAALDVGYWVPTSDAESPLDGDGIFNGNFATGAQLGISLFDKLDVAFNYLYSYQTGDSGYDLAGFVGTSAATDPFGAETNRTHNLGTGTKFQLTSQVAVGGYFGYTFADSIDSNESAEILNWNAYLTIADLFKEGSAFVVSFGQPPTLIESDNGDVLDEDEDNPYLLDVEYRFNLTDNINVAPGGYVLFNPDGDNDNNTVYVGTIRTIFSF